MELPNASETKNYISTTEALKIVKNTIGNIDKQTIRSWVRKYKIGKKIGGRYRINPIELEMLLSGQLNETIENYKQQR